MAGVKKVSYCIVLYKMSAKCTMISHYTLKYPQLNERLLDLLTGQRSQGKFSFYMIANVNTISCDKFVYQA